MLVTLRLAIALAALALTMPLLTACNTTAGFGQDMSAGGHALTNKAEQAKHN